MSVMAMEAFAGSFVFGLGCFVIGIAVTLAVQSLARLNDGEVRR